MRLKGEADSTCVYMILILLRACLIFGRLPDTVCEGSHFVNMRETTNIPHVVAFELISNQTSLSVFSTFQGPHNAGVRSFFSSHSKTLGSFSKKCVIFFSLYFSQGINISCIRGLSVQSCEVHTLHREWFFGTHVEC